MGHMAEPGGAVVVGCKVLPVLSERGMVEGAIKKIVHGKKAVVRVLRRAAQARPHGVSARKWKVVSLQGFRGSSSQAWPCDDDRRSSKWDVGSCSSASSVLYSPMSAPAETRNCHLSMSLSRQSSGVMYSHGPRSPCWTGQWITTDSDFVVLELL